MSEPIKGLGGAEPIFSRSIVSARDLRGKVEIEWGPQKGQFEPEDARVFANVLLREALNAECDAYLYGMLRTKLHVDDEAAWAVLTEWRAHRARLEQVAGLRRAGDEIPPGETR